MTQSALLLLLLATEPICTAFGQDVTFRKTHYTAPNLKTEPAVDLTVGDAQLAIVGKKPNDFGTLTIPFASIEALTYESDTRHRIREGGGQMAISPAIGAAIMATKTTSYWLDIRYHDAIGVHTAVLQLDKTEYKEVLETLKAKSGKEIPEAAGEATDINPTAGSRDVDELVGYSVDALIAAIKPAMADVGCNVTVERPGRVECKRPRGGSELTGPGGEKIVATFESKDNQTKIHIETDRGFNGHMMKKNWSTPIFKGMMNKLQPEYPGT